MTLLHSHAVPPALLLYHGSNMATQRHPATISGKLTWSEGKRAVLRRRLCVSFWLLRRQLGEQIVTVMRDNEVEQIRDALALPRHPQLQVARCVVGLDAVLVVDLFSA
jgi:hypothetical protein